MEQSLLRNRANVSRETSILKKKHIGNACCETREGVGGGVKKKPLRRSKAYFMHPRAWNMLLLLCCDKQNIVFHVKHLVKIFNIIRQIDPLTLSLRRHLYRIRC